MRAMAGGRPKPGGRRMAIAATRGYPMSGLPAAYLDSVHLASSALVTSSTEACP